MRALLAPLLCAAGCLDFSILETPLDGGGDRGVAPLADLSPGADMAGCLVATGSASQCTTGPECPPAHDCVSSGGSAPGVCLRQCGFDDECGCAGSFCVSAGGGGSFCSGLCELAGNGGCPADSTCDTQVDGNNSNRSFTFCRGLGPDASGDTCNLITDCAAGDSCVDTTSGPRCLQWCRTNASDCPQGQGCYEAMPPLTFAGVHYGFCM